MGLPSPSPNNPPVTRPRDLNREAEFVRHAAYGIADPEPLIRAMHRRASQLSGEYVTNPMEVRLDLNRLGELRDELVDGANYGVWWLEEHIGHPDAPNVLAVLQNLAHAFHLLTHLQGPA